MSEIKSVGWTWMVKFNQSTPLPFKGLMYFYWLRLSRWFCYIFVVWCLLCDDSFWYCDRLTTANCLDCTNL